MAVAILAVVRTTQPGRRPPTLRVQCGLCGAVYTIRAWPCHAKRRIGCVSCTGRINAWAKRKANLFRPGVPGMACSDSPAPSLDLSERELAWLGLRRGDGVL